MLPVVSIICCAYNHGPYIRQCLDGFMMQKTDFSFEVLIHDDASTDNTAEIIREYELKYPDTIIPVYAKENKYSKGIDIFSQILLPKAKGKYIAICEGDDYWTDPLKLQKQVDFLENNPSYVMCSHRFRIYIQNDNVFTKDLYDNISQGVIYDLNTLLCNGWYYHPLTVMFRLDKFDYKEYARYSISIDFVLFFHLLKKGKGYMFPDIMATYRVHHAGKWAGANENDRAKVDFLGRIGIYEVEKSNEAAFYLREMFTKLLSRIWMIREWRLMLSVFKIISRHWGFLSCVKLYADKLLFNKNRTANVPKVVLYNHEEVT